MAALTRSVITFEEPELVPGAESKLITNSLSSFEFPPPPNELAAKDWVWYLANS